MLDFIVNNDYYTKFKKHKNKDFSILEYFIIEDMNEKFWEKYKEYKIYLYFEENLKKYIQIFYRKMKKMKYFDYFFKLLPPAYYNKDIIELVYKWVLENINTFSINHFLQFKENITNFFEIILEKKINSKRLYNLLEVLKNNLGNNYNSMIIFLLNNIKNDNDEEIIKYMIKILIFPSKKEIEPNDLDDNLFENISIFINEINKEKFNSKIFLSLIKNLSISEIDLFYESKKFELFEILLKNNIYSLFNEINKKTIYWENCSSECLVIAKNLEELNIPYINFKSDYKGLKGEKIILERITSIYKCIKEENYKKKSIEIKDKIYKSIQKVDQNLKDIENLIISNNFINYNKSNINNELSKYKEKIVNSPLKYINSDNYEKEYSKFKKDIKRAKEILQLSKSYVFVCIFSNLKKKFEGQKALEGSVEKMETIKNIFISKEIEKELKNNYEPVKYLINLGYENEEKLSNEIDRLLNFFKINNYDKNPLIKLIKIYIDNKSLFSIISGIQILFDNYKKISNKKSLNQEEENFYKKLNENFNLLKTDEIISIEQNNSINDYILKYFDIKPKNKKKFLIFLLN